MSAYLRKSKEDRVSEIHFAALELFLKKGYRNTTMEDIVATTSLSKGGVYHYYNSTKEIFFAIMQMGNHSFFENNLRLENTETKEEICDAITNAMLDKALVVSPGKKLYLMFSYEIIYDKEFESFFHELEQQAIMLFENNLSKAKIPISVKTGAALKLFIVRFINAFSFIQNLLSDHAVLSDERKRLYKMLYPLVMELFE